jgi:hypothetical protein
MATGPIDWACSSRRKASQSPRATRISWPRTVIPRMLFERRRALSNGVQVVPPIAGHIDESLGAGGKTTRSRAGTSDQMLRIRRIDGHGADGERGKGHPCA